jgi:2-oxoisovalerate dehydrogenase E1 component
LPAPGPAFTVRVQFMAFPIPPAIFAARNLQAAEFEQSPADALLRVYAWMHLARVSDNRILELFRQGLMRGTVTGGQGNEALIVPLALLADKALDTASFTHRDAGAHLIWSGDMVTHLNQYFANAGSPTKAREGNIHHGDPANRSVPMISHLGAMLSVVAGVADSQRRQGRSAVGFAFFGDGGSSTGDVHETLNLASLLSLPVLFVIENNHYAYSTPEHEQYAAGTELWKRATAYGIESLIARLHGRHRRDHAHARVGHRQGPRDVAADADRGPRAAPARSRRVRHLRLPEARGKRGRPRARPVAARPRSRLVAAAGADRVEAIEAETRRVSRSVHQDRPRDAATVARRDGGDVFAPASDPFPWLPEAGHARSR